MPQLADMFHSRRWQKSPVSCQTIYKSNDRPCVLCIRGNLTQHETILLRPTVSLCRTPWNTNQNMYKLLVTKCHLIRKKKSLVLTSLKSEHIRYQNRCHWQENDLWLGYGGFWDPDSTRICKLPASTTYDSELQILATTPPSSMACDFENSKILKLWY